MEIKRTRVNYNLLGKIRGVKYNCFLDKTMYAKKMGLIKNMDEVIVIDISNTSFGALKKVYKFIKEFGYDRKSDSDKIKKIFNIVKDEIKSQYLIVCDRIEYLMKTKTKFINDKNFSESPQYIDDNYAPLRINFDHLSKVEEERIRRSMGDDYVMNEKFIHKKGEKEKMTFKKVVSGLFDMVFTTSMDGL